MKEWLGISSLEAASNEMRGFFGSLSEPLSVDVPMLESSGSSVLFGDFGRFFVNSESLPSDLSRQSNYKNDSKAKEMKLMTKALSKNVGDL